MKTPKLRLKVMPGRQVILPLMPHLLPGDYDAVLVASETTNETARGPLNLPIIDPGPWTDDLSLRREDLYDDRG